MKHTRKSTVAASKLAAVVVFSGAFIGAGVAVLSCDRTTPAGSAAASRPADRVYTVRGAIRMLPSPGKPTAQLMIEHEPIGNFENPDGSRGMASMTMPFMPSPEVSLGGFALNDVIEFDLSIWNVPGQKAIESYRVTRMKKLGPETKLNFEMPPPTLGTPPGK